MNGKIIEEAGLAAMLYRNRLLEVYMVRSYCNRFMTKGSPNGSDARTILRTEVAWNRMTQRKIQVPPPFSSLIYLFACREKTDR